MLNQHCVMQVYLILDEFIMGGELEETSKKVRAVEHVTISLPL